MKSPLITPPTTPQLDVEDTETRGTPPLRDKPVSIEDGGSVIIDGDKPEDDRPADGSDESV